MKISSVMHFNYKYMISHKCKSKTVDTLKKPKELDVTEFKSFIKRN